MMNKTVGWLLIGGATLWWLISRGIDAVKVSFEQIKLISISSDSISLSLSILVKNPLFFGVLLKDLTGTVYLMDVPCAVVNYPVNQRIKAGATSRLLINIDVLPTQLGSAIWANIQTGNINTLLMRFKGRINVNNVSVPIDREFVLGDILDQ